VKWAPTSDESVGSCHTRTIGISAFGVTMGDSYQVCPDKDDISLSTHNFADAFEGVACAQRDRSAAAETIARAPTGDSLGWSYDVNTSVVDNWAGC